MTDPARRLRSGGNGCRTANGQRRATLVPLRTRGRDLDEAALLASRAFHYDPFFEYLERSQVRRARALALFWRSALGALGSSGQVWGARQPDGRLVGVAAWVPPGHYPLSAWSQGRELLGGARAMILGPRSMWDGLRYLLAIDKAHPRGPLWYLLLLVVDPSVQRSGIGGQLQAPGLGRADDEGLDCYLETQKYENLAYYRRFGYEVVSELHPVASGPPLWTMRRACRPR